MSHENSMSIEQRELESEYAKHVASKSNKGIMRFIIKALVIPLAAILIIVIGGAFAVANFSPAMYAQAKDIIFENVDFEKITGKTNAINSEYLDSWLVLNSEQYQVEEKAQEQISQEEPVENQPN